MLEHTAVLQGLQIDKRTVVYFYTMLHASPSSREQQRITAVNIYKFNRSIEDTARFVKRSARWVKHWVDRDQQTGSVTDAPRSGRPTKLSQAARGLAQIEIL